MAKVKKICEQCGNDFCVWPSKAEQKRCSRECFYQRNVAAIYQNKEWLYQKYIVEELSQQQIAELVRCSASTVARWLGIYNIPKRNHSDACNVRNRASGAYLYHDKVWLYQEYIEGQRTVYQMADECECDPTTICNWMARFGISRRSYSEASKLAWKAEGTKLGSPEHLAKSGAGVRRAYTQGKFNTEAYRNRGEALRASWTQEKRGVHGKKMHDCAMERYEDKEWATKEWLYQKYVVEKLTCTQIAAVIGQPQYTVVRIMEARGIPRRTMSENVQLRWETGVYANTFTGKSFEPYPSTFNGRFKQMIRERDEHTCICGKQGKDVHHINYVKNDTAPENCITLCHSCHSRTGGSDENRGYWQIALTIVMEMRGLR